MNKRWLPLLVFALLAALLATGVMMSRNPDRDALPSPLIDKPAPEFILPDLFNPEHNITLGDLRGAPFVMNVWGSWCVACRDEHKALSDFAETRRVRVIGYNWKDEPEDAKRWLEQLGNPFFMVVQDIEGRTALDFGIYGAPETFLVDRKGVIRWKHVGILTPELIEKELLPRLALLEQGK
ncbi:DsbE family thiol:disulfide interchange protein [Lysobacteraceae bacterium NML120232]|nr:DsbE family thiol:disulfide interchange protein [Xanthomonadaceae bacterium NML08-0793]PJK13339.1 DsbE family thiol:disulfide interchange protein [Xanthomonadaceae bacterium NML120232]